MKDKILEAVHISKTYGEGESAVHALRNSVHHRFQRQRKIYAPENSGRTFAAHHR